MFFSFIIVHVFVIVRDVFLLKCELWIHAFFSPKIEDYFLVYFILLEWSLIFLQSFEVIADDFGYVSSDFSFGCIWMKGFRGF